VIRKEDVREVLVALDSADHDRLLDIIGSCNGHRVSIKIMPDLYDIISGQARTNQIYGFPLIEITPQLMPPWEESTKRLIDVVASALVIVAGLPLWILISAVIKVESRGTVLYIQERVGKDGVPFNMIKFRSMRSDAELKGPQWANHRDPRGQGSGRSSGNSIWMRYPDEINILKGI